MSNINDINKYKVVDATLVDTSTGEQIAYSELKDGRLVHIQDGAKVISKEQQLQAIKYRRRRENLSDFIWVKFQYGHQFHPTLRLPNVARMILLASYINDRGYSMAIQDIKEILKINANLSLSLRKELQDAGITTYNGDNIFMRDAFFYRGEMQKDGKNHIRLYTEATKTLFSSHPITKHKLLAYIFKMIPYVNRQTNILSSNQEEQVIDRIEHLTIRDFCALVDYEITHAPRLRRDLARLRINGQLAVGFFDSKKTMTLTTNGKYIIANPQLFYGGDISTPTYKKICRLFADEAIANLQ